MAITSRISGNGIDRSNRNGNGHSNGNGHAAVMEEASPGMVVPGLSADVLGEGEGKKEAEGRDAGGRFVEGNKCGPGNPYSRRVANLKIWLSEVVDQAGMQRIGKKLAELAEAGNVAAARLLFQYLLPKEVQPDRMNIEEWRLLKEDGDIFAQLPGMMTKPGSELALAMVRGARPMMTEQVSGMTANLLRTPQEKIGDVSEMLVVDPQRASEYLKTGKLPEKKKGSGKGKRLNR